MTAYRLRYLPFDDLLFPFFPDLPDVYEEVALLLFLLPFAEYPLALGG